MVARSKTGKMVKVNIYKTMSTTLSFILILYRSSRSQMFFKIVVLKNFANVFIKKEAPTQVFSLKFTKFLRTPFFTQHLKWLPLFIYITGRNLGAVISRSICRSSHPEMFCKKGVSGRCFTVNFAKFLRTPCFYKTPLVAASDPCVN